MNRIYYGKLILIIGGLTSFVTSSIWQYNKIEKLRNDNYRLRLLIEKLKYEKSELLKTENHNFLKDSFDKLVDNLPKKTNDTKDANDVKYLFNSDSSDSFEEFYDKNDSSSESLKLSASNIVDVVSDNVGVDPDKDDVEL